MFILYVIPALLISNIALGDWFCTENSSKLEGNTYTVCGVAEFLHEGYAREAALRNAIEEFEKLCKGSYRCKGASTQVTPLRLVCKQNNTGYWKCYRALRITIDPTTSTTAREQAARDSQTIVSIFVVLFELACIAGGLYLLLPLI